MKLNKCFMLGLAGLAFAACSNDENVPTDNTEGKVYVSLSLGSAKTRSLTGSAAGEYNTVKNLKVFFYTSGGQYVNYTPDEEKLTIAVDDLGKNNQARIEFTGVPGSADQIYIIANEKENNPIEIGSWSDVENTDIYLQNQVKVGNIVKFSNEESTMTGFSKIIGDAVSVDLTPVTCRLEVQNFIAKKAPDTYLGKDIASFEVKGIYINAFYTQGKLGNIALDNRARVDMNVEGEGFNATAYERHSYSYLYDEPTYAPMANPNAASGAYAENGNIWKVSPSVNDNWWGYSVLKGYTPDMVIELDVVYDGETAPQKRYLTITSYKDSKSSENIKHFERGHAYRMQNFMFDVTNLTERPYEKTKNVSAIVNVLAWVGVDVEPGFN